MVKTTKELLKSIMDNPNLNDYLSKNSAEMSFDTITEMVEFYLKTKGLKKNEAIARSNIESHYAYQIISGKKTPSRDKLIMLCFGLKLNYEETQHMLKKSGLCELYPRSVRDSIIIFSILHQKSIIEANELLYDNDQKILE